MRHFILNSNVLFMLDTITPVILTFNEAPNIGRTLQRLHWAREIVVVDSFSSDTTKLIAQSFKQVRFFERVFDTHATQWNFAIQETGIKTAWVLALDADFLLGPSIIEELKCLNVVAGVSAYAAQFDYAVWGTVLPGTAYPAVSVLFDKSYSRYIQDGHTQRLHTDKKTVMLKNRIVHDDRKPMSHWVDAQKKYSILEVHKMLSIPDRQLSMVDRIRKTLLFAPVLMFFYCYIVKGAWRKGWKGLFYAGQRLLVELMLALFLIEKKFNKDKPD